MDRETRLDRMCLAAAFAVTLGWFFVLNHFNPDYLVDESGHLGNIYHFLGGNPGWPEQMTMLPGYHFLVTALWELHPPFRLLTLARLVSTLFALGGLAAFAAAWRRIHGQPPALSLPNGPGRATLLLALLPILQPFTGLAYTDAPGLALVLIAFALQLRGRYALAALVFVVAAFFRQTNLVWAAFVVAWEWWRADAARREFFARTRWLICVLAFAAGVVLATGRITVGSETGTALRPNIATLHFATLLILLLGLPAWLARAPATLRRWRDTARAQPGRALAFSLAAVAAIVVLALTFANPHPWNRELFWPDAKFTLLRNWPLVQIDTHPALRWLSAAGVVLAAVVGFVTTAHQPRHRELWLALVFGALLPFGNNLVEPRYFIPAAAFLLLFLELDTATWRRLATWWALLCALHAPFIARGLSLW